MTKEDMVGGRVVPNGFNKKTYCPKSFSGGGLYSNGNGLLLWSVVGDCDYGVCGDCNDIDLATVAVVGVVIVMPLIW